MKRKSLQLIEEDKDNGSWRFWGNSGGAEEKFFGRVGKRQESEKTCFSLFPFCPSPLTLNRPHFHSYQQSGWPSKSTKSIKYKRTPKRSRVSSFSFPFLPSQTFKLISSFSPLLLRPKAYFPPNQINMKVPLIPELEPQSSSSSCPPPAQQPCP